MSDRYYVIIEHIKLSRDLESEYEADQCNICECGNDIIKAYECGCECHVEIREQQKIVIQAENLDQAEELAAEKCTLEELGDMETIDSGLADNQETLGIQFTHSEKYKSYD